VVLFINIMVSSAINNTSIINKNNKKRGTVSASVPSKAKTSMEPQLLKKKRKTAHQRKVEVIKEYLGHSKKSKDLCMPETSFGRILRACLTKASLEMLSDNPDDPKNALDYRISSKLRRAVQEIVERNTIDLIHAAVRVNDFAKRALVDEKALDEALAQRDIVHNKRFPRLKWVVDFQVKQLRNSELNAARKKAREAKRSEALADGEDVNQQEEGEEEQEEEEEDDEGDDE